MNAGDPHQIPRRAPKEATRFDRAPKMKKEEALKITLDYFNHFREAQPLKVVGQISSAQNKASEHELDKENSRNAVRGWRALRFSFAHKLVAVVPTPRPWLDDELGNHMRESYPNLLGVQVVNLDNISINDRSLLDDTVHEELGFAAAKWIAQGTLFQDHSVIGVGSGRGVFQTVRYLQEFPPLGARDVTVMSVTGEVHAKSHSGSGGRDLDADTHAAMMLQCFFHTTNSRMVNHPITYENEEKLARIRAGTHLAEKEFERLRPRYGLFGVGVLNPGHRLYDEAKGNRREPTLKPILEPLVELVRNIEAAKYNCQVYRPVADIANHLFCVHGRHWDSLDPERRAEIES